VIFPVVVVVSLFILSQTPSLEWIQTMKGTAQAISIRVEVNQTRESTSIVILEKFEKEFVAGRM